MSVVKQSANAVRLDPRRVEQLKNIALKLGTTNAGVIAQTIRQHVAAGTIPADIPGIGVRKVPGGITIGIDDAEPVKLGYEIARQIASSLRAAADNGASDIQPFAEVGYGVMKQGTGIKFLLPFSGTGARSYKNAVSFPPDLAADLAGVIEKAAQ
ncbi:hypothetical protein J2W99_005086 [Bosea robiniae]|uniref:hypothetical protein n=1 Tax=Bosea TaxID=85413 RepID=UPI00285AD16E|nr:MULTISPECIES: hypothetical protein [Bosea]MDR6831333.1 hypothetical protein [Bosea robiniae]MDR6898099.1 hypothetical protein [Bosea sp. BE109]MDR7141470.1 hypothetical protein [Bosea sp. BE168]